MIGRRALVVTALSLAGGMLLSGVGSIRARRAYTAKLSTCTN